MKHFKLILYKKEAGTVHMLVYICFYYVWIKYKNNFTQIPTNLLEKKKLCVFEYSN